MEKIANGIMQSLFIRGAWMAIIHHVPYQWQQLIGLLGVMR